MRKGSQAELLESLSCCRRAPVFKASWSHSVPKQGPYGKEGSTDTCPC